MKVLSRLNKIEAAKDKGSIEGSGQITFDTLNGGLSISTDRIIPKILYIKQFNSSDLPSYINKNDLAYDEAVKNFKSIFKDIKSLMDEFDNKLSKTMKKYGYTKKF